MKHRPQKLLESVRLTSAAATKRLTLWFAEGCVDSLYQIASLQKDAEEENDQQLLADIDILLKDLGLREEAKSD